MVRIVSFCLPQVVPVSALSMFNVCRALMMVFVMWGPKVSFGSRVSPRTVGFRLVGMIVLFICSDRM